jgi:hypothetical protein
VHASYILRTDEYAKDAGEVVFAESGNLPSWADCEKDFWSASDEHERRNGRVYREIEFALPRELTEQEQIALAKDFARDVTWEHGLPYTLAIHQGRGSNPHAHLMLCERGYDGHERSREQFFKRANGSDPARGGAAKVKALTKREWVSQVRETWTINANVALEHKRVPDRIDHRSYANQGVDTIPQMHLGRPATQAMRRGDAHPRLDRYQAIQAERERVEPMRDVAKPAPELARVGPEEKERKEGRDGRGVDGDDGERVGAAERDRGAASGASIEPGTRAPAEPRTNEGARRREPRDGVAHSEPEGHERVVARGYERSEGDDRRVSSGDRESGGRAQTDRSAVESGQAPTRRIAAAVERGAGVGGAARGDDLDQDVRARTEERGKPADRADRRVLSEATERVERGGTHADQRPARGPDNDSSVGVRAESRAAPETEQGEAARAEALKQAEFKARLRAMRIESERRLVLSKAALARSNGGVSDEARRYLAEMKAKADAIRAREAAELAEKERAREQARQDAERQREAARRREQERAKQPTLDGYKESLSKTGIRLETLEPSQRAFGVVRGEVPTRDGYYLVLETDPKKHPDGPDYVAIEKKLFTRSTWPEKGDRLEVYRSTSRLYVHDRDHDLDMER